MRVPPQVLQLLPRSLSLQAYKEKLIALLKKEVKHIMEESVMLKSIHEDSATVTSLCAVVDTCLSLGKTPKATNDETYEIIKLSVCPQV